jgi:hypothetical protein
MLAILAGICNGIYPVPIKAPRVLALRPHPVVFQAYKTSWVLVCGLGLVAARSGGGGSSFVFSAWGVVSAMCWIPAGLLTIYSVPIIGVGPAIVLNNATNAAASFLFFWLAAPLYLAALVVGMAALVAAPRLPLRRLCGVGAAATRQGASMRDLESSPPVVQLRKRNSSSSSSSSNNPPLASAAESAAAAPRGARTSAMVKLSQQLRQQKQKQQSSPLSGVIASVLAGVASASRWGAVELGKRREKRIAEAIGTPEALARYEEMFASLGSWALSFGLGAAVVTGLCFAAVTMLRGKEGAPPLHLRALFAPASLASICWVMGSLFGTTAVELSGDIVAVPTMTTSALVTSGAFGLLYYKEMNSKWHGLVWCAAAAWTVASMLLLRGERVVTEAL